MSEIVLYNLLKRIPEATDDEVKEVVADVASTKDVVTKTDLAEVKADVNAIKWMVGLLLAINVAFIVSAVGLMIKIL
ncbi:MAG: hypothetical protein F4Y58_00170 [Gammaproteobacteria bacterium]|nr:hypothetical protein [Gammaproteobacteria bacterium]